MTARFALLVLVSLVALNACTTASAQPSRAHTSVKALGSRGEIRATLAKHRTEQIDRLEAYAAAGVFPHNYTSPAPLHMFKDANGTLCAVANLVNRDGLVDLVNATAHDRNELAFADVTSGPLHSWAIASGLTIEEIARIQKPAPRIREPLSARLDKQRLPARSPRPGALAVTAAKPKENLLIVNQVVDEDTMRTQVREHFARVLAELRASNDKSLELALDRWFAELAKS